MSYSREHAAVVARDICDSKGRLRDEYRDTMHVASSQLGFTNHRGAQRGAPRGLRLIFHRRWNESLQLGKNLRPVNFPAERNRIGTERAVWRRSPQMIARDVIKAHCGGYDFASATAALAPLEKLISGRAGSAPRPRALPLAPVDK